MRKRVFVPIWSLDGLRTSLWFPDQAFSLWIDAVRSAKLAMSRKAELRTLYRDSAGNCQTYISRQWAFHGWTDILLRMPIWSSSCCFMLMLTNVMLYNLAYLCFSWLCQEFSSCWPCCWCCHLHRPIPLAFCGIFAAKIRLSNTAVCCVCAAPLDGARVMLYVLHAYASVCWPDRKVVCQCTAFTQQKNPATAIALTYTESQHCAHDAKMC